jgi:predicted kinase
MKNETAFSDQAYVMVGAPGAGKSTHVRELLLKHPNSVVVSGDDIRAQLYGNADIQGNYSEILDVMHEMIEDNVGNVIILDGTHYKSAYRKEAIAMLNSYGYTNITAIVVDRPLETCLKQNASRSRNVPEYVIERMHRSLAASMKNLSNENFQQVEFV